MSRAPRFLISATAILLLISLGPVTATAVGSEQVFTYSFDHPVWEPTVLGDDYRIPRLEGARTIGHPGEPMLPVGAARILLPPGERLVSVRVVPDAGATTQVSAQLPPPAQGEIPLSFEGPIEPTPPKAQIYGSADLFPSAAGRLATVQIYRGHAIAYVQLYPLRVRPAARQAEFTSRLRVEITTEPDPEALAASAATYRDDATTRAWLARHTDNPEMAARYADAAARGAFARSARSGRTLVNPDDTFLHVIVTSQTLYPIYEPLAADRTAKGLPSTLVTVSDIYSSYDGRDNQERIRNFILDAYQNWESEYVFFAGDIDVIPDRDCYCYVIDEGNPIETNNLCCELYYGGLDGTWNDDNDDRWGEVEEADLVPDIHVGRVCADNATEAQRYVTKLLRYERQPVVDEVESASFYGEYLWDQTWGGMYMEEIRLGADTWGYTTAGVPLDWDTATYYEMGGGSWSGSDYINEMSTGCHMAHHLGHSNSGFNCKVYTSNVPDFTANGIDHTYNFGYSQGCHAGEFDEADCIHEEFVHAENGFVAWIGNTRYGFGVHYTTNGSSQYYHRQFVDALWAEGINELAGANDDSRADNVPYIEYESNRWVHYEVTAFGDPSMPLWTARPQAPLLDHAGVFVLGMSSYDLAVTAGGSPVAGARVCLFDEMETCYGFGVTDETGAVTIALEPGYPGTMHLVVSDANLLVTEETFPIVPNGPFIVVASHGIDDTPGGNGDGDCDAGETIDLSVELTNVWGEPITGVYATLSCANEHVTLTDDTAIYGDIPGGATQGGQGGDHFVFAIDGNCPDQELLAFDLEIRDDGEGLWTASFSYVADAPVLSLVSLVIDDDLGGDGNGCLDPGESALVTIRLANGGHREATTVLGTLISGGLGLVVSQPEAGAAEIPIGGDVDLIPPFEVSLESWSPTPGIITCLLNVAADWNLNVDLVAEIGVGGFVDDMEDGEGAWTHEVVTSGFNDQWHRSGQRNHTPGGSWSWKFGDAGAGDYTNLADGALVSQPIEIAETTVLTFHHWMDAEVSGAYPGRCYDGGRVEMSLDGGPWEPIEPEGGYPYLIREGSTPGPFPVDTPVFSGAHDWELATFIIEGPGGLASFRFRFGSDGADTREGWFIDDVEVHSWSPTSGIEETRALVLRPMVLSPARPNPFSAGTQIAFGLAQAGPVRLTVHDLLGRLVRTLFDGPACAGTHRLTWDGRRADGRPAATGVYFYRLSAAGGEEVRRLTLLR